MLGVQDNLKPNSVSISKYNLELCFKGKKKQEAFLHLN